MSGDNSCKLNRGMKTSVSVSQQFTMADQCTLNPDGTLKDASEILFYNDLDDPHPFLPYLLLKLLVLVSGPNKLTDSQSLSYKSSLALTLKMMMVLFYQRVGFTGLLLHIPPAIRLFLLLTHLMPFLLKSFLMLWMAIILT